MGYGKLIRDAWTTTWRVRFLWVLGLFAGGAAGVGWRLLREHPGASVLAWLISLALGLGAGLLIALGVLVCAVPLAAVGAFVWSTGGLGATLVAYAVLGLLVLIVVGWGLWAIASTFAWNYWTLAYLRLRRPAV